MAKIISPVIGGASRVVSEKNWIQGALKPHKKDGKPRGAGTLTKQAANHGQSPAEFCASDAGKSGIGAQRCNMRKNLMKK